MSIDQHLAPLAEVLQRVGLHIRACLLQVIDISLLIRTPLLFENLDVLVGFPFVWAEQQEIGFPRALGIRDNDVSRDGRFHDEPPSLVLRYGRPSTFDAVMGWG